MAKVLIQTLGCKLNQAESQELARRLFSRGYSSASGEGDADLVIINTCTVTSEADRQGRQLIRRALRSHPKARVVVTGCYVRRAPEEIAAIPGVAEIVDNPVKAALVERQGSSGRAIPFRLLGRTRALVKIQEGCNYGCTYCIVPRVRGRGRSQPPERLLFEVVARVGEGYSEVVLTGTQLGDYGAELKANGYSPSLASLVADLLPIPGLKRLRLSSLQPRNIAPAFLSLWQDPCLCRHFHLPLQSGSPALLHRMARSYTVDEFQEAVSLIRERVPGAAITTDVMVGFPGEGEEEFLESYRLCNELAFSGMHLFPFSPRPGTRAAQLEGQVPEGIKKERMQRMLALARELSQRFRRSLVGQSLPVLWEEKRGALWEGLSDNYVRVFSRSPGVGAGRIALVKVTGEAPGGVLGETLCEERNGNL